jgi:hypothetical protein
MIRPLASPSFARDMAIVVATLGNFTKSSTVLRQVQREQYGMRSLFVTSNSSRLAAMTVAQAAGGMLPPLSHQPG